ncbi:MAG: class I SAM-dependent DNA methyltransferase [Verrucomicrobiota bacterium]
MSNNHQTASALVQKVWNYAHLLRDDGLSFMDYTEQITFLLFLRMAHEREEIGSESVIPKKYNWTALSKQSGDDLEVQYSKTLRELGKLPGLLGVIFAKAQNKITDPAKLERLLSMIEGENWSGMDMDVKGEIYEGLLARNAEDVRGGAGQYFTPRPVIRAIVKVMRPEPTMRIADPACGTGGFLLAAYEFLNKPGLDRETQKFINEQAIHGNDIVPNVTRLCAMNLYLHGLGGDQPLVTTSDSLAKKPALVDMVLTNPPFGKKSSVTFINDDGKAEKEKIYVERSDFWATNCSNKQLNFVQHIHSMLTDSGRAAVVVPDNVLFEAGAGEKIRRKLLERCNVHTLLRLPTGIWYSPGVKANVLFFDKKPAAKTPWTNELWVYDLRTNKNFTLRQNPIADPDLTEFIECYQPGKPVAKRKESERFKRFTYDDLMARDKANLDIFWLKDDSLADTDNLPHPSVLFRQILEDLAEAMQEFQGAEDILLEDAELETPPPSGSTTPGKIPTKAAAKKVAAKKTPAKQVVAAKIPVKQTALKKVASRKVPTNKLRIKTVRKITRNR